MARAEVSRVDCEEETVPGAPAREKMVEAPALSGAAGANPSPHTGGGRTNEAGLWSVDLPG
jgi:hypothetical protein